MPLDVAQIAVALLIVTIGSALQGSVGFGLGPLAVPLLVLIEPRFIPGPLLLDALLLTSLMFMRERYAVSFGEYKWAISGRFTGTLAAALLLHFIAGEDLTLWFAIMVFFAVILSVSGLKLPVNRSNLFGAGTVSGFMGTIAAIGGAPMALIYQHSRGPQLRGTLSGLFIIGTLMGVTSLIIVGRFGMVELKLALLMLPGIVAGYFLSGYTRRIMDRGFLRPAILSVSTTAAIVLLIKYFW